MPLSRARDWMGCAGEVSVKYLLNGLGRYRRQANLPPRLRSLILQIQRTFSDAWALFSPIT